jgi:hypothetical protein
MSLSNNPLLRGLAADDLLGWAEALHLTSEPGFDKRRLWRIWTVAPIAETIRWGAQSLAGAYETEAETPREYLPHLGYCVAFIGFEVKQRDPSPLPRLRIKDGGGTRFLVIEKRYGRAWRDGSSTCREIQWLANGSEWGSLAWPAPVDLERVEALLRIPRDLAAIGRPPDIRTPVKVQNEVDYRVRIRSRVYEYARNAGIRDLRTQNKSTIANWLNLSQPTITSWNKKTGITWDDIYEQRV